MFPVCAIIRKYGQIVFTDDAVDSIYRYSGGIPRLINMVCDKALLAAYVLVLMYMAAHPAQPTPETPQSPKSATPVRGPA